MDQIHSVSPRHRTRLTGRLANQPLRAPCGNPRRDSGRWDSAFGEIRLADSMARRVADDWIGGWLCIETPSQDRSCRATPKTERRRRQQVRAKRSLRTNSAPAAPEFALRTSQTETLKPNLELAQQTPKLKALPRPELAQQTRLLKALPRFQSSSGRKMWFAAQSVQMEALISRSPRGSGSCRSG